MPELAAIYAIGILVCWAAGGIYLWSLYRYFQSSSYRYLNQNLELLGLRWSESAGRVLEADTVAADEDFSRAMRSTAILILLCSGMSWLGLLVLSLYILSAKVLTKSRLEKDLFDSALSRGPMPLENIQMEYEKFKTLKV